MKIISCNYTGNIPGIGRGPVTNVKISDSLYNQLRNMGYNLRITVAKATPVVQVTKAMHVPSLEEKRAATLADTDSKAATATKISPLKKSASEVKEETPAQVEESPKVEEQVETKVEEATPAEVQEPTPEVKEEAPAKTFTAENLEEATDEELEAIIPADVKRPVRYGRKWLLKTAANYV